MALPTIKDLVMYVNKALDSNAWNTNWQKIVNWLTSGTYDIKVKSIEISQDGGITNNGSLTQNGNLSVGGDLQVDGTLTGDGSGLYNLQAQGLQTFTPFCVNNGNKTNGEGDLIVAEAVYESTNITKFNISFKVGDGTTYPKLKATTSDGNTFELDELVYETPLASNGTYNIFITSGQRIAVAYRNTIYRQASAPTSNINTNDVWLNTSGESLSCYKYADEGIWEKWNFIPVGKVVVENLNSASATATITTFPYNQNGYTVNKLSAYIKNSITEYALDSLVSGTKGTSYQATKSPYFVVFGATYDSTGYASGYSCYLQVSKDGTNWTTVWRNDITVPDAQQPPKHTSYAIVDAGLYFKLVKDGNSPTYTMKYAPLYPQEYPNN